MIIDIGIVAGDIWHYLDTHGEVTFAELLKGIGKPRDLALMSLGWLSREGHVILQQAGKNEYRVSLRKDAQG